MTPPSIFSTPCRKHPPHARAALTTAALTTIAFVALGWALEARAQVPAEPPKPEAIVADETPPAPPSPGVSLSVETLAGLEKLRGEGVPPLSIDSDAGAGLVLRAGDRRFAVGDLLFLSFGPGTPSAQGPVRLRLTGGDSLWGRIRERTDDVDEDSVRVESLVFAAKGGQPGPGVRDIDIGKVRLFLFQDAFESARARRIFEERLWKLGEADPLETDVLHLKSGDPIEGFLDDIGDTTITFGADKLGDLDLAFAKVRAVALAEEDVTDEDAADDEDDSKKKNAVTASPSRPSVRVYFRDGGRLSGRLSSLSSTAVTVQHAQLGDVELRLSEVAQIGFLGGRCQFLSDLEPVTRKEHLGALFRRKMPCRRDANVLGGPLRIAGKTYPKGLGVHAYSRLEYDVAGTFSRFQATIGLDEIARPRGNPGARGAAGAVVFRVFLDDKELLEQSMAFDDAPRQIDVSIAGGKRLALEVDFGKGDFQMALDRADWCSARVIKK